MPIPSDFNAKAALIQQGALAYAAAIRQPGQPAEQLIASVSSWIESQSDSVRTLEVTNLSGQKVSTTVYSRADGAVLSSDEVDVFVFVVRVTYLDDESDITISVAIPRASLEA